MELSRLLGEDTATRIASDPTPAETMTHERATSLGGGRPSTPPQQLNPLPLLDD